MAKPSLIQTSAKYGSKNIGATNTYRVIGLKAALPVFLCDSLKGAAGVVLLSSYGPMYMILGGILAMMGHNWSIFLGFKGGRGVATGLRCINCFVTISCFDCLLGMGRYCLFH